jgi:hypothetical protein
MIMPVASKRKTPASLEAVDATFSPTFFDESQFFRVWPFLRLCFYRHTMKLYDWAGSIVLHFWIPACAGMTEFC